MISPAFRLAGTVIAVTAGFRAGHLPLVAQTPRHVTMERAGYVAWLKEASNSPFFALAQRPVGTGLRLGPADADIPLDGIGEHRLVVDGATVVLEGPTEKQQGSRGRSFQLGKYRLYLSTAPAGPIVTVFGPPSQKEPPGYYPYDPSLVFIGPLLPPEPPGVVRVLGPDGIEVDATEAGTVLVPLGGMTRLRVRRIPLGGGEESELEIFFRDGSNGDGSYPAGRFVSLVPAGDRRFRLDFNLARNPFCAYSSVYLCPAPWRGNVVTDPVRAGERYAAAGLDASPVTPEMK
jgi:hypothetical protein